LSGTEWIALQQQVFTTDRGKIMGQKSRTKQQQKHLQDVRAMQERILQGWAMSRATGREPFYFIAEPHKAAILQDAINGIRNNLTFNGYHIKEVIEPDVCAIIQIYKAPTLLQLPQGRQPRI
jgi:hypothetical protein